MGPGESVEEYDGSKIRGEQSNNCTPTLVRHSSFCLLLNTHDPLFFLPGSHILHYSVQMDYDSKQLASDNLLHCS